MNKFWKFEASVSSEGSALYLEGAIAEETWWGDEVTPEAFRADLRKMKGDLTVHINSPGGDVFAGVAIYNAIKDYSKGKVIVKVDGIAASIASVIAMAGDEIVMAPGSMMMIHNPWTMGVGNSEELRKVADTLDEINESVVPIYVERSGLSKEEVQELLDAETWLSAERAVEMGFADRVQKTAKEEKPSAKLLMANFAFNMSASKSAMADLINKVKNSERNPSMEEEPKDVKDEVVTADEPEVENPVPEEPATEEPKAEVEEAPKEEEEKPEEEAEAPTEDENAEEGEKGEEEPAEEEKGDEGNEVADGIEAKIKALQDKISALEEENNALKEKMAVAEEKMSKQDALQARYSSILNMAEEADGGDVSGEKEEKQVDTYGDALKEAFQEY